METRNRLISLLLPSHLRPLENRLIFINSREQKDLLPGINVPWAWMWVTHAVANGNNIFIFPALSAPQ